MDIWAILLSIFPPDTISGVIVVAAVSIYVKRLLKKISGRNMKEQCVGLATLAPATLILALAY